MIRANVRGGLAGITGLTREQYVYLQKVLTFKKYDYRSGQTELIKCYIDRGFGHTPQMLVPRCFNIRAKLPDISFNYKYGSEGNYFTYPRTTLGEWNGINQEEFVAGAVKNTLSNSFGGICLAPCGTGKTKMGLEIIKRLGRSALVVLSRKFQIDQWKSEAKSVGMNIGVYSTKLKQSGKDFPVVVGLINSLHKESDEGYFRTFGTTIMDECHHAPANTWTALVSRLTSKYIFGISAGLQRSDRMNDLFEVLLGPVIVDVDQKRRTDGEVEQVILEKGACRRNMQSGIERVFVAKALASLKRRNQAIMWEVIRCLKDNRSLLVFSDLVEDHLSFLHHAAFHQLKLDAKMIVGSTSAAGRKEAEKARVTFTTYSMANEGLDIPCKDTIICATPPTANLQQLKGRIDRVFEGKKTPLIIDLVDDNTVLRNKATKRKQKWEKLGLKVTIRTEISNAKTSVQE